MSQSRLDGESRFDDAFRCHWQAVFRFAAAWTNDLTSAEDLAQEAFARLWDRRDSIDWEQPIVPWLLVVTRRLATDRARRLRRSIDAPRVREIGVEGVPAWLDIQAAFGRLSPRERAALVSVAILGLSPEEAGEPLGMSAGAIRADISRARDKLESER